MNKWAAAFPGHTAAQLRSKSPFGSKINAIRRLSGAYVA